MMFRYLVQITLITLTIDVFGQGDSCIKKYQKEALSLERKYSVSKCRNSSFWEGKIGLELRDSFLSVQPKCLLGYSKSVCNLHGDDTLEITIELDTNLKDIKIEKCNEQVYYINGKVHVGAKYDIPYNKLGLPIIEYNSKPVRLDHDILGLMYNAWPEFIMYHVEPVDTYVMEWAVGDGGSFRKVFLLIYSDGGSDVIISAI